MWKAGAKTSNRSDNSRNFLALSRESEVWELHQEDEHSTAVGPLYQMRPGTLANETNLP